VAFAGMKAVAHAIIKTNAAKVAAKGPRITLESLPKPHPIRDGQ
jgi:hypothetical protein